VLRTVGSLMVRAPIIVGPHQPVAQARRLMLMHSFSFLPVHWQDEWHLLSELGLPRFLNVSNSETPTLLGLTKHTSLRCRWCRSAKRGRLPGTRRLTTCLSRSRMATGRCFG
jgi:CBS domain-containing protein